MHPKLEQAWELKTAGKKFWEFDLAYRAVQRAGCAPEVTSKDEKPSAVNTSHPVSNGAQQTRLPADEVLRRALERDAAARQKARNKMRRFNEGWKPHPVPPVRMVTNPWLKPRPNSHHSGVYQGVHASGSHSSDSSPPGTQTSGSHNSGNRPWGKPPAVNQSSGGRPSGNQPFGNMNRPSGNHSSNNRPSGNYTPANRPSGNPPTSHHISGNRPSTSVPAGYRQWDNPPPANNPPGTNRSDNGPSGNQAFGSSTSGNVKSGSHTSGNRPPSGPKSGNHWQRGPQSRNQSSGSHQPNHRPTVSSPLTQQWKQEKNRGWRQKSKSPKKARHDQKSAKEKLTAHKSEDKKSEGKKSKGKLPEGQKPEGQKPENQTPAEAQQPLKHDDSLRQNPALRLSPEVKKEPGTERPLDAAPAFIPPAAAASQASSQPSSQTPSQAWSNPPSQASSQTSAGTQTAKTPPRPDHNAAPTHPAKQPAVLHQPPAADGSGANQDVVTVLEALVSKSFSELCSQMTENIRTHVTESFENKHRELAAQNRQLVEKLEQQQIQLLDKHHAWLLTNNNHPVPDPQTPTVLASIETDSQSQHWDTEEWRYINAPVLGHSDDSADETYAPTINFALADDEDDGADGAGSDRDTGGEEEEPAAVGWKGKGKEAERGKGKWKGKEKEKGGSVLLSSSSKKRKHKGKRRAHRRRRAREQEGSSDGSESSVEEKTPTAKHWKGKGKQTNPESSESSETSEDETPRAAKRRKTWKEKETSSGSSDSSDGSDGSDSSDSSAEETPAKRKQKAREQEKGARSGRSKTRFKESPVVNPYLTKIAEERRRHERMRRMAEARVKGGYLRCARGRFA